jgi:hypothetical protein
MTDWQDCSNFGQRTLSIVGWTSTFHHLTCTISFMFITEQLITEQQRGQVLRKLCRTPSCSDDKEYY